MSLDFNKNKHCILCDRIKPIDEFYKSNSGLKCKECILKITRDYKREKRKDINFKKIESEKQKERRVRLWQNTLINDSKNRKLDNSLTIEDINKIYENQNGLCYWFNIPLIPSNNKKHPQQPSLDRLDRNKGYTMENVVLSCYSANIGRNESDVETWLEFLKILKKHF